MNTVEHESSAANLLSRRLNKSIAVVLGVKEREIDQYLPQDARASLRKVVLDQFNAYHELCLDVIKSLDNGTVVLNEIFLEKMEEIRQEVRRARDGD